jgi:hypothetical protein
MPVRETLKIKVTHQRADIPALSIQVVAIVTIDDFGYLETALRIGRSKRIFRFCLKRRPV